MRLPGQSTLVDYTNYILPRTGFQHEVVEDIRCAAEKLGDHQKYVVLLHDEMSIKEDFVFDNRSQEVVGFVNVQNWQIDANYNSLASHVLVFYVVGINSSLKKNMGFFATRTARAEEIYPLFWEAVWILEQNCRLKVAASTSDKAPTHSPTSVCISCMVIQRKFATKPSTFIPLRQSLIVTCISFLIHLILSKLSETICSTVAMAVAKQCVCGTMENIFSGNM